MGGEQLPARKQGVTGGGWIAARFLSENLKPPYRLDRLLPCPALPDTIPVTSPHATRGA